MWNAVALLPLLALRATAVPSVVELESLEWTVTNQNNSISVPAKFPSLTHLDLLAAGVIDDPLRNLNEFTLRWVAWQNWTYSAPVPQLSSSTGSTWLVFDGLDTFASITMCGKLVGNADNMFRQWFFDVSNVTSSCTTNSTLSINFGSAPIIAQAINNTQGTEHWPTSPIDPEDLFEIPFRQYVRKEQNDFGWDWSPAFASAGPWQPAQLVHLEPGDVFVRNTAVDVRKESQLPLEIPVQSEPWVINASMDILGTVSQGAKMNYRLLDSSNNSISSGALTEVNITSGSATGLVSIDDSSVDRWWPNGYGDQTLYFLEYSLVDSNETTLANVTKRIGFRTIMLNSFPVSDEELAQGWAAGNHFHFEVNGHELYMKGSNFVPPDPFWPRITPDLIRMILESCKSANQNMIRVWSSGTYSPNFMHDIADELGLLLWSEFEFSVAMYPVAEDFLNSVREEVIYNTRRLSHHASLAFWAGGNELEKDVLPDLRTDQPSNFNHWIDEYEILFLNTIFPALFESQRSISYLPTGAGAGWIELNYSLPIPIVPRLYNTTPGEVYGDVDRYNYDTSQSFDITTYLVGRFANEFGFPSMPSTPSWQEQIDDEFLTFNSSVIVGRNRHYPPGGLGTTSFPNSMKGMGEYTLGVERWFPTPKKDNSLQNFTAWCHATQLFQASYIRNQIEFYRRGSGRPERQLGALYWQLNDIWIAPSWSSMTYDGRWKALHYLSKDIFQPVVIAPYFFFGNSSLEVYVISDLWSETAGTANLTWYDWSGDPLNISSATVPFTIGAINTTRVLTLNVSAAVPDFSNAVLFMEQTSEGQLPNTNTTSTFTHENYFVPGVSLVHAKLVDPGLEMSFSSDTQSFSVTATKGVAAFVWLEYPSGAIVQFDANGFWLRKGQTKEVGFTVVSDTTGGSWVNNVTVESVWDLTTP